MVSVHLTSLVETHQVFDRVGEIYIKMCAAIKLSIVVLVTIVAISNASPSPLRLRRGTPRHLNKLLYSYQLIFSSPRNKQPILHWK